MSEKGLAVAVGIPASGPFHGRAGGAYAGRRIRAVFWHVCDPPTQSDAYMPTKSVGTYAPPDDWYPSGGGGVRCLRSNEESKLNGKEINP